MHLHLHLTDDTELHAHGCVDDTGRPLRRDHTGTSTAPSADSRGNRELWGTTTAMRRLAELILQAAHPGRGGGRLAGPHRPRGGRQAKAGWHERPAGGRPRLRRPRHPRLPRALAPPHPGRGQPGLLLPPRARPATGRPSIPSSATASRTPPPTPTASAAGGDAGPRPMSAWPPASASTPSTSTAPPAWPPSASSRKRRACGSPVRWWPRGAVAGTTGSARPGWATAHPAAWPTSTGAAAAAACSPHPAGTSPVAPTAGWSASTRRRCPRSRPPSAPGSTPTSPPRPGQPARLGPDTPGHPYGRRVLAAELAALGRATPGQRNHTLNRAAFKVYRYVAGGLLTDDDVKNAFTAGRPRHRPGPGRDRPHAGLGPHRWPGQPPRGPVPR